jgi:predicted DNA binding CopG/RHH family protein
MASNRTPDDQRITCRRRSVSLPPYHLSVVKNEAKKRGVNFSEALRAIIYEWDRAQPVPR